MLRALPSALVQGRICGEARGWPAGHLGLSPKGPADPPRAIEGLEDPREAYLYIHERWLVRGLGFVANGRWDEAYAVYREMQRALEDALL